MATKAEITNAVLKGLGLRPTSFLLRWNPYWKNPFNFDLLEVMKCDTDGEVVTLKSAQSPLGTHAGHKLKNPQVYSIVDVLSVQLRIIQ
jgi:hypothetical protein